MINLQTENLHTRLDVLIRISVWKNNQFKRLCRVAASSNYAFKPSAGEVFHLDQPPRAGGGLTRR